MSTIKSPSSLAGGFGNVSMKTFGLLSHAAIDVFQDIHRQLLSEHDLELAGAHAEGFFDAEKLRKLLQQGRRFTARAD